MSERTSQTLGAPAAETYTPAEAAERSGFSLDTLRYYEREGILPPVARSAGGRRTYTEVDLARLGFLRCLRDTGMPIALLKRYGELSVDDSTLAERAALLEDHATAVRQEIEELRQRERQLAEKVAWYRSELVRSAAREPSS